MLTKRTVIIVIAEEYLEKSEKLINEDRYEVNSPITIEILNLSVTWVSHQTQRTQLYYHMTYIAQA